MAAGFLVVGLGNPGPEYAHTRHNVGADAIQILASRHGAKLAKDKVKAMVDQVRIGEYMVALATPLTYMNDCGLPVAGLVKHTGAQTENLIVVHDELDLPTAVVRVKVGGGLAGHNGLRSIDQHLHSQDFVRVRIGIGKPPGGADQGSNHVLKKFSKADRADIDVALETAADAVESIISAGTDVAMNRFNATDG